MGRTKQTATDAPPLAHTVKRLNWARPKLRAKIVKEVLTKHTPSEIPLIAIFDAAAIADAKIVIPEDACVRDAYEHPKLQAFLLPSVELEKVIMNVYELNHESFRCSHAQDVLEKASIWVYDNHPDQLAGHNLFNRICDQTCEDDHAWDPALEGHGCESVSRLGLPGRSGGGDALSLPQQRTLNWLYCVSKICPWPAAS